MDIKLKNIRVNLTFSQETTMFKADIYINGKKVGYAENDGNGGSTFYHEYEGCKDILRAAEDYCKTLPKQTYEFNGKQHEFDTNLEGIIDTMIENYVQENEHKKFKKKQEKDMLKGLVVGNDKEYSLITWKGLTIAQLLSHPKGKRSLQDTLDRLKSEGRKVLNTNLPKDLVV